MYKRLTIFVLFILFVLPLFAQELKMQALNRVVINKKDTLFEFYTHPPAKKSKIEKYVNYYWYKPDTILVTQGGFDKKLLNGDYTVFYPNQNVKEKGQFSSGIKYGKWKAWYPDGKLQSVINWKKGNRNGYFEAYDSNGSIIRSGVYKNDLLSGELIEYLRNGTQKKVKYKKGNLVITKASKDTLSADQINEIKK